MPIEPEYIPLPKRKEMFAVTSWRDSPAAGTAAPSPHLSGDTLRGGKTASPCLSSATTAAAGAMSPPPSMPAAETPTTTTTAAGAKVKTDVPAAAPAAAGGRKKKRKGVSGSAAAAAGAPHPDDVDDFFVHILLPKAVPLQTLEFELQAQATPLRTVEVGQPHVLFPRRTSATGAEGTPAAAMTAAPARVVPSPFQTPAVNPATNEHGLPPMSLPPSELLPEASVPVRRNGGNITTTVSADGVSHAAPTGDYQVSLLFAEQAEAERTVRFVQRRWPTASVSIASRSRSVLNATLVLKGLPNQAKTETVLQEIGKLPHVPSYVRLLRSERGVFKGVVFVKYANCEVAEECKLRLEQFVLGSRQLKVEFKKKSVAAPAAHDPVSESKRLLQELVRDLRVSNEHEGFRLDRASVSKEELKALKQLCQSYGLLFDMTEQQATVRRVLGGNGGNGAASEKASPAMRPQAATPAWAPATPAPLRPMDFKGISHWKDIRSQANTLGIVRPVGPEDGRPAFSAGRGRLL